MNLVPEQTDELAPLTVFYSYAHEDEALRDKLEDHLRSLQAQGFISVWHDRQIVAGAEWAYAIDSHLQTASIILLLISPAFMASDYCVSKEMQQAMARHRLGDARVIPIILEPTAWQDAPFAILQCLPRDVKPVTTWDDPEDAFEDIAQGVRRVIEEMNRLYAGGSRRPSAPIDSQSRQCMLKRVREIWITGLLKDFLKEAALLTPDLYEQPDAVANPLSSSVQEMNRSARPLRLGTRIIQAYDDAQGGLLILGEPGSGKTTLLLELTRDLIKRAEGDETHPIPVVFTLSSWSLKRQPIADWLVEELIFKYQVPRKLAKQWVENEQVLPLLDGLDEVAPNHRAACIEAVNTYKQAHGLLPMVICSRTADYAAQQSRVLLRTAIVVQPLTQTQIELYLASAKKQLAPVRAALEADAELLELASTPLMLSVLALAYHESSLDELLAIPSHLARRRQIFATYVQRMFQRRGAETCYKREQTVQWLTWLAQQMQQQHVTEFYLEQFQVSWLPTRLREWYRMSVGPVSGLVIALLLYLLVWIVGFSPNRGIHELLRLVGFLFAALLIGSFFGLLLGPGTWGKWAEAEGGWAIEPVESLTWSWEAFWSKAFWSKLFRAPFAWLRNEVIEPVEIQTWSWGAFWSKLRQGLYDGLLVCLIGGLLAWGRSGQTFAIFFLFGFGISFGLVFGLLGGFTGKRLIKGSTLTPNEGIYRSLRTGLLRLVCWIIGGLVATLVTWLIASAFGSKVVLQFVLFFALLCGLAIEMFFARGGLTAVVRHYLLRFWLWQAGCTPAPWDYVPFLNYATERILLRKVGGGYIFMHRLLLDYFASLEQKEA
jgi:TIR domain/NACHT domain